MGVVQTALTTSFGYFTFTEIPTGKMYTLNVSAKQLDFDPQQVTVNGDVTGIVLMANAETAGKVSMK
jgi:hypothetical protein